MDPRDVFCFEPVDEGPAPREVVPGFGQPAAHIVRVIVEDGGPERWVDIEVLPDGTRELAGYSSTFDDAEEARAWAMIESE